MGNRRREVERAQPFESESLVAAPVKRGIYPFGLDPAPSVGQPEIRPLVAPVGNEHPPFGIGDEPVCNGMRRKPCRMAWPFAVESEVVAGMTDVDTPGRTRDPADGIVHARRARS